MARASGGLLLLLLHTAACWVPQLSTRAPDGRRLSTRPTTGAIACLSDDDDFLFDELDDDDGEEFDVYDESAASSPRGFGFGGSALDSVKGWIDEMDAEDEADGVTMATELKAKRNRILLRWADFMQQAGGGEPPTDP
eukprot:4838431-Prymnesium_polylepis.1